VSCRDFILSYVRLSDRLPEQVTTAGIDGPPRTEGENTCDSSHSATAFPPWSSLRV
jgi:hypothetical protein